MTVKISNPVVGNFISDLQLSEKPPIARGIEADWLDVQRNYIDQVRLIQQENGAPIFIAGDILEHWKCSPLLLSEVIRWLQGSDVYGIPGNHDLPEHNYKQLHRSGYWTLVEAGVVKHLTPGGKHSIGCLEVTPFPYGFPIMPPAYKCGDLSLDVALVHDYVWTKDACRINAPEEQFYKVRYQQLKGYDVAVFGDNHKSFLIQPKEGAKGMSLLNCGSLLRRHSDEKAHRPSVGLLHSDGRFERRYLNVTADKFTNIPEALAPLEYSFAVNLTAFSEGIGELHGEKMNLIKFVLDTIAVEKPSKLVEILLLKFIGAK
jgi:hypothetical protein